MVSDTRLIPLDVGREGKRRKIGEGEGEGKRRNLLLALFSLSAELNFRFRAHGTDNRFPLFPKWLSWDNIKFRSHLPGFCAGCY